MILTFARHQMWIRIVTEYKLRIVRKKVAITFFYSYLHFYFIFSVMFTNYTMISNYEINMNDLLISKLKTEIRFKRFVDPEWNICPHLVFLMSFLKDSCILCYHSVFFFSWCKMILPKVVNLHIVMTLLRVCNTKNQQ